VTSLTPPQIGTWFVSLKMRVFIKENGMVKVNLR
jgi:hypothetical protein